MSQQNKITGIILLLLFVCITTAMLNDAFIKPLNLVNLIRYISMFGIIGIGAVFVIITGGIDLSIGSLIGLTGCILTLTLNEWGVSSTAGENLAFVAGLVGAELLLLAIGMGIWSLIQARRQVPVGRSRQLLIAAVAAASAVCGIVALATHRAALPSWISIPVCLTLVMIVAVHAGLLHGVLITKLRLQPFVVTLCGLMCYRGLSRWLANDRTQGFGTRYDESLRLLAIGRPCTATLLMLLGGVLIAVWGVVRILFAGREDRRRGQIWGVALIVIGATLAVIGSSKYWDGWTTSYGDPIVTIVGWEVKTSGVTVTKEAQQRPADLMKWAMIPFAVAGLSLIGVTSRRHLQSGHWRNWIVQLVIPGVLVIVGTLSLVIAKRWIGDEAVMLNEIDWARLSRLLSVCVAMAVAMTGIYLLISPISRSGKPLEKAFLAVAGTSAILWLLSATKIHETKIQVPFFVMLVVAVLAGVFLRQTIFGRYLFALGRNEEATRYSGINTDRMIILAYVVCSVCAGIGGILFTLDSNNVEPSGHGNFYELYAIAAAVLGGCSLRGGEGSIIGVVLGAAIMRVLFNAPNMIGVSQQLELFTMGVVILIGVMTDEQIRRAAARRLRSAGA